MTTVESRPHRTTPERGTSPAPGTAVERTGRLRHDRTVDRALVHKNAVGEVLLTDHDGDPSAFVAAAQLPADHPYYGDHLVRAGAADPLLLLECCRQAETLGVHTYLRAPADTKFVLQRWQMRLPGLAAVETRGRPTAVTVAVTPRDTVGGTGTVRGSAYDMEIAVAGRPVGSVTMAVGYVPSTRYDTVRRRRRGSPPPMSDRLPAVAAGRVPLAPHSVGRSDPRNVVLERATSGPDGILAHVLPALDHPSMFDHPQDHLPGMTLTEAARQAAVLSFVEAGAGSPEYLLVTGLNAVFHSYTELDRITRVHATVPRPDGGDHVVTATVTQDGRTTATVDVRVTALAPFGTGERR